MKSWLPFAHAAVLAASILGAAPASAQSEDIGRSGLWLVQRTLPGSCGALQLNPDLPPESGNLLRVDRSADGWTISSDIRISEPMRVAILVDGKKFPARFEQVENVSMAAVKPNLIKAMAAGREFDLGFEPEGIFYSLKGFSKAVEMVEDCVRGDRRQAKRAEKQAEKRKPAQGLDWVEGTIGAIDARAVAIGTTPDGLPNFPCAARYNGGMHPGTTAIYVEGCNIGFAGSELTVDDYQVVIGSGRWTVAKNGRVPNGAVQGGHEANGEPLYVCRAERKGGTYAGKVREGFDGCNIPYRGAEVVVRNYDVLTR